jgi:hypothetical protein
MAHKRTISVGIGLLVCSCMLLQTGCAPWYTATRKLDYAPLGPRAAKPAPYSLAVVPFDDDRPPRYYPSETGRMFLTYIPLIPYISIPYERLDESLAVTMQERGQEMPDEEYFKMKMAEAVSRDLAESGIFREVRFVPKGTPDTDYVLEGKLRSTEFDVNATSYMLGGPGVLLWFLPIPIGSDTADVELDLALVDRAGQTVWQHSATGHARQIFTFYNSSGAAISNQYSLEIKRYGSNDKGIDGDSLWAYHADALRSAMGDAKLSLASYMEKQDRAATAPGQ